MNVKMVRMSIFGCKIRMSIFMIPYYNEGLSIYMKFRIGQYTTTNVTIL